MTIPRQQPVACLPVAAPVALIVQLYARKGRDDLRVAGQEVGVLAVDLFPVDTELAGIL